MSVDNLNLNKSTHLLATKAAAAADRQNPAERRQHDKQYPNLTDRTNKNLDQNTR